MAYFSPITNYAYEPDIAINGFGQLELIIRNYRAKALLDGELIGEVDLTNTNVLTLQVPGKLFIQNMQGDSSLDTDGLIRISSINVQNEQYLANLEKEINEPSALLAICFLAILKISIDTLLAN